MPRDDFESALQSLIAGGLQGYSEGRKSELEIRKEFFKEQIKRQLFPEESELKSAQAEYYRGRGKSPLGELTSIPQGYEIGYDKVGRQILKTGKKPSETDTFRDNLRKAKQAIRTGESSVDEEISILEDLYPEKDFTTQKFGWKSLIPKTGKTPSSGKSFFSKMSEGGGKLFNKPNIQSKVDQARSAGYSDEEIAAYLKGK